MMLENQIISIESDYNNYNLLDGSNLPAIEKLTSATSANHSTFTGKYWNPATDDEDHFDASITKFNNNMAKGELPHFSFPHFRNDKLTLI